MTNMDSGSATAGKAALLLASKGLGYLVPTAKQKKNLVVAFAKSDKIVYGKAFDVVRLEETVNLDSLEEVEANLSEILLCEIKSTKKVITVDFRGHFFGLTAAEVLVAQSLKNQFRSIFVNTVTVAGLMAHFGLPPKQDELSPELTIRNVAMRGLT